MDGISVQNSDQKAKLGQLKGCGPEDQRDFKASSFNRNPFYQLPPIVLEVEA